MTHKIGEYAKCALGVAVLTVSLLGSRVVAQAQDQGGPPPPQGGDRPPMPGMRRPRASVVDVPVEALYALHLTDDQRSQLKSIQKEFRDSMRGAFRPGRFGGPGGPGGDDQGAPPPPPQDGDGNGPPPGGPGGGRGAMREVHDKFVKRAEAVLTDDQKQQLPKVLREADQARRAGIPLEVLGDLKLTDDQKQKIGQIVEKAQANMRRPGGPGPDGGPGFPPPGGPGGPGDGPDGAPGAGPGGPGGPGFGPGGPGGRGFGGPGMMGFPVDRETHEKVMAVLTGDQKAIVQKYVRAHPAGPFGRPGGPGGPGFPPPGGPGGPGDDGNPPPPPGGGNPPQPFDGGEAGHGF